MKLGICCVLLIACSCAPADVPPSRPKVAPTPRESSTTADVAPPTPTGKPALPYPTSRVGDDKDTFHGVVVPDPFRWLEDATKPDVKRWMEEQNALARAELGRLPERNAIAARLKELFYIDELSAPLHRGGRYFYTRRLASKEKRVVYWKEGKRGGERVLLDPNAWSADGSTSLGGWQPSWDGRKVAYKVRQHNSDEATMYVMDVATGKRSEVDVIEGTKYAAAAWTPSGDGFYYTWLPTDASIAVADRPGFAELRFHKLGDDPKKDPVVHERTNNPSLLMSSSLSQDGHWLVLTIHHGWSSNDVYFKDARGGPQKGEWKPLSVGKKAHYRLDIHKDRFYVSTDEDAPRWRVFQVDPMHAERSAWKEVISQRDDATLDTADVIGGRLVVAYLKNASSRVEVHELDGKLVREVQLPGLGTVAGVTGRPDEDEAYFSFESYLQPREVRMTSIKSGKTELYSELKVPLDPTPFTIEQVFYPSKDGTRISMFVVHRKDFKKDGTARLHLYGYGGFQDTETPLFLASVYPWLERGGVYAVANLRGGGEYGEAWHEAGMLLKKQNVFDDFIAGAEYLVRERYTRPGRLVIAGASNGGLLVTAAMVQRPDLFGSVVCAVPLTDMVRYHLFGSGKTWISEFGSAEDPEQFKALFAYSPYHHVRAGTKYPPILLLSADSDDRVDPMHARKFAAALQHASTGGAVLLRIERNSGHMGADLLKAEVEKSADRIAFELATTPDGG